MTLLLHREKAAHWYRFDRETGQIHAFHEVPYADKKKAGQMRPTTLKDARNTPGALVSVSTLMKVKAKPGLENWKQEQAILAALTITRLPGEGDEAFVKRVIADMEAESEKAKDTGLAVHDVVEHHLLSRINKFPGTTGYPSGTMELAASCLEAIDREVEEIYAVEATVGNPALGYAGRLDLHCKLRGIGEAVVDFKTQKIKRNKKGEAQPVFYWEWGKQLAAYAMCDFDWRKDRHMVNLVNVVIDTTEPGPVFIHRWENPEKEWRLFNHMLEIWKDDNNWSPMV